MISQTELDIINEQGVSIIIGARNEAKTLPMTISHLAEECLTTGINKYEVIIMDNGSEDDTSRFFTWKPVEKVGRWKYQYSPRGMVANHHLRVFYDPVLSNVGTRNKGAWWARYPNLIFADAHIITRVGTVASTLAALNKYGGIIHAPVSWMGADSYDPDPSYQYSYKVGEKIWGTWNRIKLAETPFYIPLSGHCWLAVKKKEFLEKRGYPFAQRVYGGGEPYLDTKWWMTGSTSMCDPGSLVFHLSAGRGYNWHNEDLIHNMFLVSYILGGKRWADRILITYLNKPGVNLALLRRLYDEALHEGEEDKKWLDEHKIMEFEEMLGISDPLKFPRCENCTKRGFSEPHNMRPWDMANDKLLGLHRSYVTEFKLERRNDKIYIGETEINHPEAVDLANRYV